MSLSAAQLALRKTGITATDVGALVNLHPNRTRLDVFLEKTGRAEPFDETTRSRWGHILEHPIRDDYAARRAVRVELADTFRHHAHADHLATPDGLVYLLGSQRPDRGLEIKTHGRDALWFGQLEYGAPGTDEVPAHELVQCQWGMHVTELERWDLVAFLDGVPVDYAVDRDDELIGMLTDEADRFLVDHVRAGVEPAPDGSESWNAWLARKWKKNTDELIDVNGDEPTLALLGELRALRERSVFTETEIGRVGQLLKTVIGDAAGLTWKDPARTRGVPPKLTWKFSKASHKTAWKATAQAQRAEARTAAGLALPRLMAMHELAIRQAGDTAAAALSTAIDALVNIAEGKHEADNTKEIPGPRMFLCPRWWKTTTTEPKDDNDE